MKVIRNQERSYFENSSAYDGHVFNIPDKALSAAIVNVRGRYPETKKIQNSFKELIVIIEGSVVLQVEEEEYILRANDLVVIYPGEKYFWDGTCKMFAVAIPAYNEDRHSLVN